MHTDADSKYLSRKWILSITIQLYVMVAQAWGWITPEVFGEVTVANIVSYSFANAAAYFRKGGDSNGGDSGVKG